MRLVSAFALLLLVIGCKTSKKVHWDAQSHYAYPNKGVLEDSNNYSWWDLLFGSSDVKEPPPPDTKVGKAKLNSSAVYTPDT